MSSCPQVGGGGRGCPRGPAQSGSKDFCRWMGDSKDIPGRGKSKVRDVKRNTWDCEWVNRWGGGGGEAGRQGCGSVMKSLVHLVE